MIADGLIAIFDQIRGDREPSRATAFNPRIAYPRGGSA
jgi:hypothetical protein